MRIANVSPRVTTTRVGGSQARIGAILAELARRHDVRQFSQPRLRDVRRPLPPGTFERANRSIPAAAFIELSERTWPTAPILSGAALKLTRRAPLHRLLEWSDVTLVEFPWQFEECARSSNGTPLVLSTHNVEVEKFDEFADGGGARVTRGPWLRYVERMERAAIERADLVVAVSEPDRDGLVERYGADPERVVVAPNAADTDAIAPADAERRAAARAELGVPGDRPVVLFTGADVTPNRRGLDWVRALARASDRYTFLVVGLVGGRRRRREGNVQYAGFVPDIAPAFAAADLSLCPIQFGGGTKIKLMESLAAGLPTVAFAESVRGTELRDGEHLLVTPRSVEGLLTALDRLSDDPAQARRIGAAARRAAEERYDWRRSARVIEDALERLVSSRPSTGSYRAWKPAPHHSQ
jgi:polysaccharide biosynthesis protein PslH